MNDHWFWWLLTAACVVWYSTITVYVAIRGIFDIRSMLRRLSASGTSTEGRGPQPGHEDDPAGP
jgi:hypothetical protein